MSSLGLGWWRKFMMVLNVPAGVHNPYLRHGTRQPNVAHPVWITPNVLHGGFSTGEAAAALQGGASNDPWMTDDGFEKLSRLLETRNYALQHVEHGALLSAAYLTRAGHQDHAEEVLTTAVMPWKDQLQFYPEEKPVTAHAETKEVNPLVVSVTTVESLIRRLKAKADRNNNIMKKDSHVRHIEVVAPLRCRASELLLATLRPGAPRPSVDPKTGRLRTPTDPDTLPLHTGMTPEWYGEVRKWLQQYKDLAAQAETKTTCGRKKRKGPQNFFHFFAMAMEEAVTPGTPVSETTRRRLAFMWGQHLDRLAARGYADDAALVKVNQRVMRRNPAPVYLAAAKCVAELNSDIDKGLQQADVDAVKQQVAQSGHAVSGSLESMLNSTLEDTIDNLVDRGSVPSAEVIGVAANRILANSVGATKADPALRHLITQLNLAFRRRRSLLLISMESQVKITEVPWYSALVEATRTCESTASWKEVGFPVAQAVTRAWLRGFPGTIIPNKVLSALRSLQELTQHSGDKADKKRVRWCLQDELAADIYVGAFSETFLSAAQDAQRLMRGSFYEKMYHLEDEYAALAKVLEEPSRPKQTRSEVVHDRPDPLREAALLGVKKRRDKSEEYGVASNGREIEMAQIITTHNLALLLEKCVPNGLVTRQSIEAFLGKDLLQLALQVWRDTVVATLRKSSSNWKQCRQWMKVACYGYRQMVFYLSFVVCDVNGFSAQSAEIEKFFSEMRQEAEKQAPKACKELWLADMERHFMTPLRLAMSQDEKFDWREVPLAWFGVKYPGVIPRPTAHSNDRVQ